MGGESYGEGYIPIGNRAKKDRRVRPVWSGVGNLCRSGFPIVVDHVPYRVEGNDFDSGLFHRGD